MRFSSHSNFTAGTLSLLAMLASAACSPRRTHSSNGECIFNGDCPESLVCAGHFCRAECETDRDCLANLRCVPSNQPNRNVCLPDDAERLCVHSHQCPSNQLCAG